MTPTVAAELKRDFQTMLQIEQRAIAMLCSARYAADQQQTETEERLLRVIALRLIEQAISIWQNTTGEPITLERLAALIPYMPKRFPPTPMAAPQIVER